MADEELDMEETGQESEEEAKGGKGKLIIIIVLVLVLFGAGFAGWWFFMGSGDDEAAEQAATEETAPAEEEAKPSTVLQLSPFVVNLADPGGKRYLKLSLAVDVGEEPLLKVVEARIPQIRDSVLLLLSSKTYEDISTVAGKLRLRNEVLKIMNRYLKGSGSVHAVYFTEFVIQ